MMSGAFLLALPVALGVGRAEDPPLLPAFRWLLKGKGGGGPLGGRLKSHTIGGWVRRG